MKLNSRIAFILLLASVLVRADMIGGQGGGGDVHVTNFPDYQTIEGIVSISTMVPVMAASVALSSSSIVGTTSVRIVLTNLARKGLFLYNNSSNSVYIAYDAVVNSANHMTFLIPTFSTWIMPPPIYTGPIAAIRNAGTGSILITELE